MADKFTKSRLFLIALISISLASLGFATSSVSPKKAINSGDYIYTDDFKYYCMYGKLTIVECFIKDPSRHSNIHIPESIEYEGVTYPVARLDLNYNSNIECDTLYIPKSIESINLSHQYFFLKINHLEISKDNPYYSSWENSIYTHDFSKLLDYKRVINEGKILGPIKLHPDCTTAIGGAFSEHSFYYQGKDLLPSQLRTIGTAAFTYCYFKSDTGADFNFYFPEGVDSIGYDPFIYDPLDWLDEPMKRNLNIYLPSTINNIYQKFCKDSPVSNVYLSPQHPNLYIFDNAVYSKENDSPLFILPIPKESLTISSNAKNIPENFFANYPEIKYVFFLNSNTQFSRKAFYNSKMQYITLPSKLNSLKDSTFANSKIKNIQLPAAIKDFGKDIFAGCSLETLNIEGEPDSIPSYLLSNTTLQCFSIPESVAKIGQFAFYNTICNEFSIGKNVSEIGEKAFWGSNIPAVHLPDKVQRIPPYTFANSHIEEITLGDSLSIIGECAFMNSTVTNIHLPDKVQRIAPYTFANSLIEEITLGDNLSTIDEYAFVNSNLKKINLPDKVQKIAPYTFANSLIREINISDNILCFGEYAFFNSRINSVKIPASIKSIVHHLFANTKSLTKVELDHSLDSIGVGAFMYTGLLNFDLDKVKVIGDSAFYQSSFVRKSKTLDLPSSIESMGIMAFGGNQADSIIARSNIPPRVTKASFSSYNYLNTTLYVPEGSEQLYRKAEGWREFKNIKELNCVSAQSFSSTKVIIARYNILGIPVDENYRGIVIVKYDDGSTETRINNF